MSVTTHEIVTVRDLLFALNGVNPNTPVVSMREVDRLDQAVPALAIELHWSGKPSDAHFVRIGEVRP